MDKIRFLHIEDDIQDAEMVEAELRKRWPDCDYFLIINERELIEKLAEQHFDFVLADYSLPDYDGLTALSYVKEHFPLTNFIFVTGTMGEEDAIDSLKSGASDYILKMRLTKLVPAIERCLHLTRMESEKRRAIQDREQLLTILESTHNELYVFETESLLFTYVNSSAIRNLGYSLAELQKMTPLDLKTECDERSFKHLLKPLMAGESLVKFETTHRRADGSTYPVEVSLQLIRSRETARSCYLAVIIDISQRKAAEYEVKRNHERLLLLQDVSQYHAASVKDLLDFSLNKVVELTDSSIGYIYHYSEENRQFTLDAWSREVMEQCQVESPPTIYDLDQTGLWGEVVRRRDTLIINDFNAPDPFKKGYPQGHVRLSRFMSIPLFDNDRIVGVVGVANKAEDYDQNDVLQLKLMMEGVWKIASRLALEEKISQAGREWQTTFDSISDSISLVNAEQIVLRCNKGTVTMLGLDYRDILNQHCWELFCGEVNSTGVNPFERMKVSLCSETSIIRSGERWLEITVDPILSELGLLAGAVHIVRDITEKSNLDCVIREANEIFSKYMKYSPIYTYIKEVRGTESYVVRASENFWDLIGIKAEDMVGKSTRQLFPRVFADKATADDLKVVTESRVMRIEEFFNDGIYYSYKFPIERQDDRLFLGGFTIDVTEQKRTEQMLRDSVEQARRLRTALDSVSSCIYMKNIDSIYVYANRPTLELFGCTAEELAVYDDSGLFAEETAVKIRNIDKRVFSGEQTSEEIEVATADGGERVFLEVKTPLFKEGSGDNIVGLLGIATDITGIKKSERTLRELQTHMMQQDKLATIGQLAAGVAHEINNPMGFVGSNVITLSSYIDKFESYISALEQELKQAFSGELPEKINSLRKSIKLDFVMQDITLLLSESNDGIERVKQIVQDLRTFSRTDSLSVGPADMNRCLDSTLNIVMNEIKYVADIIKEYGDIPKISCNLQQINQVFMNLLVNAAHAIDDKGDDRGEITIRTWCDEDSLFVSVADNGCGIPRENLNRIFDAFFTTKEVGKGTGLGLSISYGIIRKHGGDISVSSKVGSGTTFTVSLPLRRQGNGAENDRKS